DGDLDAVVAVDLTSGARTILSDATTPDAANPFSFPVGITLDVTNGRALVIDGSFGLNAVVAVDLTSGARTILSDATTPDAANPFSSPFGITLDAVNNRALVVDGDLDAVWRWI
ncbi:MAG: hypothetical protein GXP10_08415, partial [Gammaproteobacteria bacterium]|nr:hypothetical protein [Gammaproteobacteria bacterium]